MGNIHYLTRKCYLQCTMTVSIPDNKLPILLLAVHWYPPAWFLLMFCRYITDDVLPDRLGPLHVIVQLGLQSAVQLIGPTLCVFSVTVYDCSVGENRIA